MKKVVLALFVFLFNAICYAQMEPTPLLLQEPAMSKTQIVFVYGGELWSASRNGGEAIRLTTGVGIQSNPNFSPDGKWIAFSGAYGGNTNVYVVPAEGGVPRQLTYHGGVDNVAGWTPDGKNVLFESARDSFASGVANLFTVSVTGGLPAKLPLPLAYEGSYSADGSEIAYRPVAFPWGTWSHYRGGTESKIWVAKLADSSTEEIPRGDWNEFDPMWAGNTIYFLSDEKGPFTLCAYDTATKKESELVSNNGFPIRQASAGPGGIIYSQFGAIHIYDIATHHEHPVAIRVAGDFPQVMPHFDSVEKNILSADISPTGVRAVFEAHGEILTVPAEHGDIRNITNTPNVADRTPAWSPDGNSIAYFSDESGEYALHIRDQKGMGAVKKIGLGDPPSYFYDPVWSPDSKKIAYTDKRLSVWYVDLDKGTPVQIDSDVYETPELTMDPSWSPDSQWIAYTKMLENHMRAVFVFSLATGKSTQVTDGMSDARYAAWDKSGKYLYFTASTNAGPTTAWLDMSAYDHTVTRSVYIAVLAKDLPSPLAPESDEEKAAEAEKKGAEGTGGAAAAGGTGEKGAVGEKAKKEETPKVTIDFENIGQRILALPIPARDYQGLSAGKAGEVFIAELPPQEGGGGFGPPALDISKFEMKTKKTTPLISGVQNFALSFNGEKFLYQQGQHWGITETAKPAKPGDGTLKMDDMKVWVDPRAEWKQMYHEVWRIERDFFYAPNFHGLNLAKAEAEYAKYLPGLASREDLNFLFNQMLGDLNVGHMFVGGGAIPTVPPVSVGLLGADYAIENGRYRIARIYNGENWNPGLEAPLTQPGVNVVSGDYIFAVDGRELRGTDNIYSFFLNKAGKQVVLKVGANAEGSGSREVTVVPIATENALRHRDWIVHNMETVNKLSEGKLAYVYLPNTAGGGFTNFNRYYFSQVGKQGAVMDERFNTGGSIANYIIETMQRKLTSYWYTRQGQIFDSPLDAIFGPKVMIVNQFSGSGGDFMPWAFRHVGLGPLIGETTWGGLVGIYGYPGLVDGGFVTAPRVAFFNPNGTWDVENHGVPPDVPILLDPKSWREGHDVQLEKAIAVAMEELKKNPLPKPKVPAFPDYSKYAH
jgi:tricorn protease